MLGTVCDYVGGKGGDVGHVYFPYSVHFLMSPDTPDQVQSRDHILTNTKIVAVPIPQVVSCKNETIRTVEVPVPVVQREEKIIQVPILKIVEKVVPVERPVIKIVEVPVEKIVERIVEVVKVVHTQVPYPIFQQEPKVMEVPVNVSEEKIVPQVIEKVVTVPVDRIVERVVEKIVEVQVPIPLQIPVPVPEPVPVPIPFLSPSSHRRHKWVLVETSDDETCPYHTPPVLRLSQTGPSPPPTKGD